MKTAYVYPLPELCRGTERVIKANRVSYTHLYALPIVVIGIGPSSDFK